MFCLDRLCMHRPVADQIKRQDTLPQGRGEAFEVMSCGVFVAVGESRPLPSRIPVKSSFVAIAGVFVARCDPCQFGRSARHKLPNGDRKNGLRQRKLTGSRRQEHWHRSFWSQPECPENHVHAEMVEYLRPREGSLQFGWP